MDQDRPRPPLEPVPIHIPKRIFRDVKWPDRRLIGPVDARRTSNDLSCIGARALRDLRIDRALEELSRGVPCMPAAGYAPYPIDVDVAFPLATLELVDTDEFQINKIVKITKCLKVKY